MEPTSLPRGAIRKEPGGRLGVALVYPNAERLAMANLGFHAVYRLFNDDPATRCERVFLPEDGGAAALGRVGHAARPSSTWWPSRSPSRTTSSTCWSCWTGPACRCAPPTATSATRWWWPAASPCRSTRSRWPPSSTPCSSARARSWCRPSWPGCAATPAGRAPSCCASWPGFPGPTCRGATRSSTPTPGPRPGWVTRFAPRDGAPGAGGAPLRGRPLQGGHLAGHRVARRPVRRPLPHRGGARLPVGLPLLRRRLRAAPLPRGGPRDPARRGEEGDRRRAAGRAGRARHQRLLRARPAHLLHRRAGGHLQPLVAAGRRHHAAAGRAGWRPAASAPSPWPPRPARRGCARSSTRTSATTGSCRRRPTRWPPGCSTSSSTSCAACPPRPTRTCWGWRGWRSASARR